MTLHPEEEICTHTTFPLGPPTTIIKVSISPSSSPPCPVVIPLRLLCPISSPQPLSSSAAPRIPCITSKHLSPFDMPLPGARLFRRHSDRAYVSLTASHTCSGVPTVPSSRKRVVRRKGFARWWRWARAAAMEVARVAWALDWGLFRRLVRVYAEVGIEMGRDVLARRL